MAHCNEEKGKKKIKRAQRGTKSTRRLLADRSQAYRRTERRISKITVGLLWARTLRHKLPRGETQYGRHTPL
jgi:hypothetical protein